MLQRDDSKTRDHSEALRLVIGRYLSREMATFVAIQTPVYLINYVPNIIKSIYTTLFVDRSPTEADVVKYVLNTPLGILVKEREGAKGVYEIDIRETYIDLKSIHFKCIPAQIRSWGMAFSLDEDAAEGEGITLHEFTLNGERITSPDTMLSALLICHTASYHTKEHTVAKALTDYIVENKIDQLRPSTYLVGALHTLLLNSVISPIDRYAQFVPLFAIFHVTITKESVFKAAEYWGDLIHTGARLFQRSKHTSYYRFLWEARAICLEELSKIGVGMPQAEFFFISTVLHSTDHYQAVKMSDGFRPLSGLVKEPGVRGLLSSFVMKNFTNQFIRAATNPLFTNRMSSHKEGTIYRNIYERIAKVDKELADVVTCSIMY